MRNKKYQTKAITNLKVCHPHCVTSITQSCSVYIPIYTYSHKHNIYIATNGNIVMFMTVCIYRYIHTTALQLQCLLYCKY